MNELILAIESSCDETSVAVIKNGDNHLRNIVAADQEPPALRRCRTRSR